jgi:hypothetical protein
VKGATFMFNESRNDGFGARNSGHLGPVRDDPDTANRLPYKMQSITLAGSHDGALGGAGKASTEKDAILFGAPHLSPPQPSRAGAGVASVAAGYSGVGSVGSPGVSATVPSPERLKRHQKAGKSKLKKLSISMSDPDAGGE